MRRARPLLGTLVEIDCESGSEANNITAINSAFAEISRLEKMLSRFISESDVGRFNDLPVGAKLKLHRETAVLFRIAQYLCVKTGGIFNPAVDVESGQSVDFLSAKLKGFEIVKHKEMKVDFGGIGKGYIVDLAIKKLKEFSPIQGLINAGGDIRVYGEKTFPVLIRSASDAHKLFFEANLENGAICSSSGYFRGFSRGQSRFQPIFDPLTGNPADGELSISVIASSAWVADALTKVTALLKDRAKDYIRIFKARVFLQSGDFFREI